MNARNFKSTEYFQPPVRKKANISTLAIQPSTSSPPQKTIQSIFNKDEYFAEHTQRMACDPQIQKDLRAINKEFAVAELDGLGKS
jgi:hypothetical protein